MFAVVALLVVVPLQEAPKPPALPAAPVGSIRELLRPGDHVAIRALRDSGGGWALEIVAAAEVSDAPGGGRVLNRQAGPSASVVTVVAVSERFLTHTYYGPPDPAGRVVHLPVERIASIVESAAHYRARNGLTD